MAHDTRRNAGLFSASAARGAHRTASLSWPWWLFALLAGLIDPLVGLVTTIPGMIFGVGDATRWDTPRRRRRGLIVILGGIEGPSLYARALAVGILRARWRGAIVVYPWNAGVPIIRALVNLMSPSHHERSAAGLLRLMADHRARYGPTRVALLGQSGGCWIIVRALEQLGAADAVDRAVLLAPAVSPDCDPTTAAARCREGLIALGGPGDLFFLGLATLLLGTSDRRFTPSAGLLGWRCRPPGFVEVRWAPAWLRYGYVGNHISICCPPFMRHVVAPWLAGAPFAS